MSPAPPLDVKIVYSADTRGRRRRRVSRAPGPVSPSRLALLGLLNLCAAGGMYYWTWWRVDKFLYMQMMLHTPIVGVDANVSSGFFVRRHPSRPRRPPPRPAAPEEVSPPSFQGRTAQVVMTVTAYSWLTLATIASCVLAVSGGMSLGRAGGRTGRVLGRVLMLAAVGALALTVHAEWTRYQWAYPPSHFRAGMGGLVFVMVLIGLALGRGVRGWTTAAALMLILSAAGSVVGLYVGTRCHAPKPDELPLPLVAFSAVIFVAQSAWGWILLPWGRRLAH